MKQIGYFVVFLFGSLAMYLLYPSLVKEEPIYYETVNPNNYISPDRSGLKHKIDSLITSAPEHGIITAQIEGEILKEIVDSK